MSSYCSLRKWSQLGMVMQACNWSTWQAEARRSKVQGQPELYSETWAKKLKIREVALVWCMKDPEVDFQTEISKMSIASL